MTRTIGRMAVGLILAGLLVIGCAKAAAKDSNEVGSQVEVGASTTLPVESSTTTAGAVPPAVIPSGPQAATEGPVVEVPAYVPPVEAAPVSDDCWIGLARQIGWPEETLAKLKVVITRESGCNPNAFADRPWTMDLSRGLLQINAYGTLDRAIRQTCGVEPETLFDPAVNLACGLAYWQSRGWRPWGM